MPASAATCQTAIAHLEKLSAELRERGLRTRLNDVLDRVPDLHVQNREPGAGALQERIYAAQKGSTWLYWWSWAEPIAEDVTDAADRIARVLRSADQP